MRITCNAGDSTSKWVEQVLGSSGGRIDTTMATLLVAAAIRARDPRSLSEVAALPDDGKGGHRGRVRARASVFHVAGRPEPSLLAECLDDLAEDARPALLVPREWLGRARALASIKGIESRVNVWPVEEYLAQRIWLLAEDKGTGAASVLQEVAAIYNVCVTEGGYPETLRIDIAMVA